MTDIETAAQRQVAVWRDEFWAAAIFLTRVPITFPGSMPEDMAARAMGWYPLVGMAIGLAAGLVYAVATVCGLPGALTAVLTLAAGVALTGGLHEDGLADTADGLGGGRTPAGKIKIMRDSRIGNFGALALMLGLAMRATALAGMPDWPSAVAALVSAGALSRCAMVVVVRWTEAASRDGLAAGVGKPGLGRTAAAICSATGPTLLLAGPLGVLAIGAAGAAALILRRLAKRHLGGYTGDVLGAVQQTSESAALVIFVGVM